MRGARTRRTVFVSEATSQSGEVSWPRGQSDPKCNERASFPNGSSSETAPTECMVAALDLPEPSWRVAAPLSWKEPRVRHVRGPHDRVYVSVRAYSDESFGVGQLL